MRDDQSVHGGNAGDSKGEKLMLDCQVEIQGSSATATGFRPVNRRMKAGLMFGQWKVARGD